MRFVRMLVSAFLIVAALAVWPVPVDAGGPWRGQIFDADTDQPVAGVIVLAIWTAVKPALIHSDREFHDVDELVTDAEGRFEIPAREERIAPLTWLDGPELLVFKPGYGNWRFRAVHRNRESLRDAHFRGEAVKREWERFAGEGTTFVVLPLRSREERKRHAFEIPWARVPRARIPRFIELLERERALFLPPTR